MSRQQLLLFSAIMSMVLFAVVTIPADVRHALSSHQPLNWAVSVVVYAVLVACRRFPIAIVAVAVIGSVVLMADGMAYPLTLPAVFYALYSIALGSGQVRTLAVGVAVKVVLVTASLITHPGITGFVVLLWASLAVTTGFAARSHHAYVAEADERARRAEQAREDEAKRRVAEERLRIARELHDAVGHHVALINVQAGALACLLDDEDRSQARESVAHIQRASEEALEDLRLTVGLLREPGLEPAEPVQGLDQLEELICSFAGAGLRVTREVTGQARPLPEAVELTAYRVIQESLTNTRKHADCDTAVVRLGYAPGALRLAVEDEGKAVTQGGRRMPEGHGIVGMRERVGALGGRLSAGPRLEGGYRVFAELPLRAAGIEGS
ncbi:histidine kinase [Microtetraspora sp. NBRC 16547]|uniref:sensor histidine kinase n=1 Tax=Microtetraspora sp. NBRC 16547 TaxID=3030993 RepID=UPI0024A313A9|nr:histidine kinase [Microtetraspora sp. NBRC 16547]GLX02156.1 two-component sensor histidine kinase [Microtetraspora sp. NBRC 16547]